MIRQCAWCCRVLGQTDPLEDISVTHGVCQECHAQHIGPHEEHGRQSSGGSEDSPSSSILPGDANP